MEEIEHLKQRIELVENFMADFVYSDRYIFQKHSQYLDGKKMTFGTNLGLRMGTSTTEKVAFYGVTPVIQASAISAPTNPGATYSQADTQSIVNAVNSLRTAIKNFGISA